MKTRQTVLCVVAAVALWQPAASAGAPPQAGAATLTVTGGLPPQPGAANPLAGRPVTLLKQSFEQFLRKDGIWEGPPGGQKVHPLLGWVSTCVTGQADVCSYPFHQMPSSIAGSIKLDAQGRGSFQGVPPGTYYVLAFTGISDGNGKLQPVVWDARVDLRPGANAVTLDLRNITPLDAAQALMRAQAPAARTAQPTGGAPGATAAADPSIAKAKAAKIDLGVFGITLGEPVRLPKCAMDIGTAMNIPPQQSCLLDLSGGITGDILNLTEMLIPGAAKQAKLTDTNEMTVRLDSDHCPDWVVEARRATVLLHDGVVVAIAVNTRGRSVEKAVNAELNSKYGPPTRAALGRITPDVGNAFDVRDPEWILPGLRVEYRPVWHGDGEVNTRIGWVRVITESAYQRLNNKPVKRKM